MDRKHRILGEKRERKGGGGKGGRKDYQIYQLDDEREKLYRNYRIILESIPIEKLRGSQLEMRKVCGNCRGSLNNPVDGHYHSRSTPEEFHQAICCECLEPLGLRPCVGPIPDKRFKNKVAEIYDKLPYHYYICQDCGRKWRSKSAQLKPCSECDSEDVKKVKGPDESGKSRKQPAKRGRVRR